jgi:hypothetical protein
VPDPSEIPTGQFKVTDYSIENGVWKVHLVNSSPGPGLPNDYYVEFLQTEVPSNINQTQLANAIKTRLQQKYALGYAPLNTAITNGMTITLP